MLSATSIVSESAGAEVSEQAFLAADPVFLGLLRVIQGLVQGVEKGLARIPESVEGPGFDQGFQDTLVDRRRSTFSQNW